MPRIVGGNKSAKTNPSRLMFTIGIAMMVIAAAVIGYAFGAIQNDCDSSGDENSDQGDASELKVARPSSTLNYSLNFDVYAEMNQTTSEMMQFIRIQGVLVNTLPFNVTSWLTLDVYYYYQLGARNNTGHYDYDASEWGSSIGVVKLLASESHAVDWTLEIFRTSSFDWWDLIQEDNATYYYAFLGYYHSESGGSVFYYPLSTDADASATPRSPSFDVHMMVVVQKAWPQAEPRGNAYVIGYIHNHGYVGGSCILRYIYNDSHDAYDGYAVVDFLEANRSYGFERSFYIVPYEPDSAVSDYNHPTDISAVKLEYWTITLW
jgi:hypothetical protein